MNTAPANPATNRLFKAARIITVMTLLFFIGCGVIMVIYPIKPFWIDEWRLIINLKFKTPHQLWGVLVHNQQCPRLYLQLLKAATAAGNYSYSALRLPSFLVFSITLICSYYISGLIWGKRTIQRFLWVLIFASFNTSLHYFVQIKQYSMEMGLAIVGFWQLYLLLKAQELNTLKKVLLIGSFLVSPLFSYTYPMVGAPIFFTLLLLHWQQRSRLLSGKSVLACGPAFILGVIVLYFTDMRQVFAHKFMQDFWADYIMKDGFTWRLFTKNIYWLFAQMGSGDLFEITFGMLGIAAFIRGNVQLLQAFTRKAVSPYTIYATALIDCCVLLFVLHKLPMGQHRVNAFMVPAIAWLLVDGLSYLAAYSHKVIAFTAKALSVALFLASVGNIFSAFINDLTDDEHQKLLSIYNNCAASIHEAQQQHLPIAVTPAIGYPLANEVEGDWVLKAQPAYPVTSGPVVYAIDSVSKAWSLYTSLPVKPSGILVVDGAKRFIYRHP